MAWYDLHDPNIGGKLDAEDFFDLANAAGLDKESVEKIVSEREWRRLKKDAGGP